MLRVTVLLAAVALKPAPLMVTVAAFGAMLAMLLVMLIPTAATWTAAPLAMPLVVTVAVRLPADGLTENATVRAVAVAAVTSPTAPLLKVTELLSAVVEKPIPSIVMVESLGERLDVLWVTIGETVAT